MKVLYRYSGQAVMITHQGNSFCIKLIENEKGRAQLEINAPKTAHIYPYEQWEKKLERQQAIYKKRRVLQSDLKD